MVSNQIEAYPTDYQTFQKLLIRRRAMLDNKDYSEKDLLNYLISIYCRQEEIPLRFNGSDNNGK